MSDRDQIEPVTNALDAESDSSDDFGNFSDASVENDLYNQNSTLTTSSESVVDNCLNKILPNGEFDLEEETIKNDCFKLSKLIEDERPHVIYEQLVQLDPVLQPFIWNKSHIRRNLLHILRLSDNNGSEGVGTKREEEPLNGELFKRICDAVEKNEQTATGLFLRDNFKIDYTPPMTLKSLQKEEEREQEQHIPQLLMADFTSMDEESLRQYHDTLCQSIDFLVSKSRSLKKQQRDLLKDKTTFENVVTNLTGHTQRLQRDEIALYNKKRSKKKRFSWVGY
ncbi:XXYS1_4_G0016280.mRNA.1.CDS.1 [Saccharomyces cerevisiae]|nr:XXYS1_4_G0016280.mRNA.1.CDS.1 [Saccharomyces cerevisiae]CAD6598035.1 EM14S01-3B_G0013690.mRNA.1.CDS.1 [Saccharomyces cerevisiae]CAI4254639.1 AMH_1a_G0001900.mRNA.1.CDS.1 [Saccharomyces cerevisiae]CAI4257511.1 CEI_1a_G0001760.mRNA.1.CDS.1 [Saccharomyces cerevisiae]CAI6483126.1 AMH_1a_G0001900.mRNA.1.CDS.1 [Saccharomyces cerevisiae]